jgi:hypothetical protein
VSTLVKRMFWGALILLAILWVAPWTPLVRMSPVAMLVAPDTVWASAVAVLGVTVAVVGRRRPVAAASWMVIACVVLAGLFAGRALVQGMENSSARPRDERQLTVLSWNAQGIPPDVMMGRIFPVLIEREVDIVVLPETGDVIARQAAQELQSLGWSNTVYTTEEATSIMVRTSLAARAGYRIVPGNPPWAGLAIQPKNTSAVTPTIIGVHVQQPSPGNLSVRAEHLSWVQGICDREDYVLAVGDFNATLNHLSQASLGRCRDIGVQHRAGASSTWPTWLPFWWGISIDRAMVSPPYDAKKTTFEILRDVDTSGVPGWGNGSGADHWPIIVTIASGG